MITEIIDICCIKHKTTIKATVKFFDTPFIVQKKNTATNEQNPIKYFYHINFTACSGCRIDRDNLHHAEKHKKQLERLQANQEILKTRATESSNIPSRYNGVCFDSFTISPRPIPLEAILAHYKTYQANLVEFVGRGRNLVAVGKKGRGKTHLAVSILKIALMNGFTGRIDDHTTLISKCLNNYDNRLLYATYDVLIIDELAVVDLQSHRNVINDIISDRYNNKKTTIINTHLPPVVTGTIIDPSRKSKLFEDCAFIDFDKHFESNDDYDYRVWKNTQNARLYISPIEMRLGHDRD